MEELAPIGRHSFGLKNPDIEKLVVDEATLRARSAAKAEQEKVRCTDARSERRIHTNAACGLASIFS